MIHLIVTLCYRISIQWYKSFCLGILFIIEVPLKLQTSNSPFVKVMFPGDAKFTLHLVVGSSGQGPVADPCEHGNESFDSINSGEFLD
jgi:hypothetical protein